VFFQHLHACVVGDWIWGLFPACSWLALVAGAGSYVLNGVDNSWLALVAGMGGYVLTGVHTRGLSYTFLYFCRC